MPTPATQVSHPGSPCRVCERVTFQNPPICLQCAPAINNIRKGNADRILERCLEVLEIPPDSEAARLVIEKARSNAAPARLRDPNRWRKQK